MRQTACYAPPATPTAPSARDHALVYTTRFAGGRGGRNQLESTLATLGITHKHSRPNHPTTCRKVRERFQQTLKRWLAKQPPADPAELQAQLDGFVDEYNHRRPHTSLGRRTPAVAYRLLPKTSPAGTGASTHHRLGHDRVDKTGAISLRSAVLGADAKKVEASGSLSALVRAPSMGEWGRSESGRRSHW